MISSIFHNDKEHISANRAAKELGYNSDYIGQLCRAGKIPGKLIGRTWYVDITALTKHKQSKQQFYNKEELNEVTETSPVNINTYFNYSQDTGSRLPELNKNTYVEPQKLEPRKIDNSWNERFIRELSVVAMALLLTTSVGIGIVEYTNPTLATSFEQKNEQVTQFAHEVVAMISDKFTNNDSLAATAVSDGATSFFDYIGTSFSNLKNSILSLFDKDESENINPTPVSSPVSPIVAERPAENSAQPVAPSPRAITNVSQPSTLATIKNELKTELESFILAHIGQPNSPVVIYSSAPVNQNLQTFKQTEVVPVIYNITRVQSDSDSDQISSVISNLTNDGDFVRATFDTICIGNDCRTGWPSGSGGGGSASYFGDLGDVATSSDATGDIYYLDSSGQIVNLGVGSDGQVLKLSSGVPSWGTDNGGSGTFAWTPTSWGVSTSTTLGFLNGFLSTASSTINSTLKLPTLSSGGLGVDSTGLVYSGATTTAGTGLTYSGNAFNVNTSQNIATLSNLTSNGFVKTSGGNGTLSVDTTTYLSSYDAFTHAVSGTSATSTEIRLTGGLLSTASTTIDSNLIVTGNSTTTNATTTSFYSTTASTTNFAIGGGTLSIFGTSGTSLSAFCTTITGSAGLCDGDDATGGGVSFGKTLELVSNGDFLSATSSPLKSFVVGATTTASLDTSALFQVNATGTTGTLIKASSTPSFAGKFVSFTNSAGTELFNINSDGGFQTTASSTLQNFTATNSTSTSATTTNFFSTTASTTNFFGAGLTTCQSNNVLTYDGAGKFGCEADDSGGGGAFAWTTSAYGGQTVNATSTGLWLTGTPLSLVASSTFFTNATTTYATTTKLSLIGGWLDFGQASATSTIINNALYAFTISTSTTATPIFRIDTTSNSGSDFAATTTIKGGFSLDDGAILHDYASSLTSISNLALGALSFDTNAGAVSWVDLPVTSSAANGTVERYSAQLDGENVLTIYSTSNGGGGVNPPRVAIGTSTPYSRFSIWATSTTENLLELVNTASTTLLTVNASGNLGLATTSPWRTLSVNGTAAFTSLTNNGAGYYACISTPGGELATSTTACGASSIKYKENVVDSSYGLAQVNQLRPVLFDWKHSFIPEGTRQLGFIAEEVQSIIPEVIGYNSNGEVTNLDYPKLTAVLTKAIQELDIKVENLQGQSLLASVLGSLSGWGVVIDELGTRISNLFVKNLHIEGDVCVDNVCITKDQFKEMILRSGVGAVESSISPPVIDTSDTSTTTPDIVPNNDATTTPDIIPDNDATSTPPTVATSTQNSIDSESSGQSNDQ